MGKNEFFQEMKSQKFEIRFDKKNIGMTAISRLVIRNCIRELEEVKIRTGGLLIGIVKLGWFKVMEIF